MYTPTEALNKLESELFDLIIFLEEWSPLYALETFDDRNILASVIKILTIIIQVIKSCFRNLWHILINRKFLSVLLNQRRVLFVNCKFNMRFMYSILTVIIYKNLVSDFSSHFFPLWLCSVN
jgi:hypothetical protein